jgi:hypothetical protein
LISVRALVLNAGSIVDHELVAVFFNKWCPSKPVVSLFSPVRVCTVAGVARETSSQLEETSVGYRVLVVVSVVECVDLPAKTAAAVLRVPATDLFVEDGLRKREP